jgi:hypothetical protein
VVALKPGPEAPSQTAAAPTAAPVAAADVASTESQSWTSLDDQKRQQLRNYLIAYSQSRAQQGMGGTLGYARYAAYTDAKDDGN